MTKEMGHDRSKLSEVPIFWFQVFCRISILQGLTYYQKNQLIKDNPCNYER